MKQKSEKENNSDFNCFKHLHKVNIVTTLFFKKLKQNKCISYRWCHPANEIVAPPDGYI